MANSETKICQNCKQNFTVEPEDFDFYKKISVPPPTFCPDCRDIRRTATRNERALYKRKCDLCSTMVVSRVSPDKKYPMYCQKCWWSDKWDPHSYGMEYDFSRPFFEQFKELLNKVPHIALLNSNTVNSDWVNQETDVKNCYLDVGGHFNEDCAYNTYPIHSRECFDNQWILHSERCYECVNCERCYQTLFSQDCYDCRNTVLSFDCRNCINVFGCTGLRNKQYFLFNEQVSKEEYEKFIKEHPLGLRDSLENLAKRAKETWLKVPRRNRFVLKSTNVSGDRILESRNSHNCWNAEQMDNGKNFFISLDMKDSYDGTSVAWGELSYETANGGGFYKSKFIGYSFGGGSDVKAKNSIELEYCYTTPSSSYCFGCVNQTKSNYCILNKQYTKEEYDVLLPKIKKHMNEMPYIDSKGRVYKYGEFFPVEMSPFGYNETAAMDYYPLTKKEAEERGYPWSSYDPSTQYQFSDYKVPDNIADVKDDILEKVLKGEGDAKAYKIIPMELEFYRRMNLSIPVKSPLQRHKDRIARLLPRKIFRRHCQCAGEKSDNGVYVNVLKHAHGVMHCPVAIETSYASDRPEIVYCEGCYQAEVA